MKNWRGENASCLESVCLCSSQYQRKSKEQAAWASYVCHSRYISKTKRGSFFQSRHFRRNRRRISTSWIDFDESQSVSFFCWHSDFLPNKILANKLITMSSNLELATNCCFCFSLATGVIIIATLDLLQGGLTVLLGAFCLMMPETLKGHPLGILQMHHCWLVRRFLTCPCQHIISFTMRRQ